MQSDRDSQTYLRRVTAALQTTKARLAEIEARTREPIAIVSAACRFPGGVDGLESFFRLLDTGTDAVGEVPALRWEIDRHFDPDPDAVGKTYSRWGGFVGDVSRFDAAFFGISPREAVSIDPQQRLLLETAWEAFEQAGYTPAALDGSRTGVYVGICETAYQHRAIADIKAIDSYSLLGTVHNAIVGRLSYVFGLKGPSLAVDTACSSSLVAVHLACQSLRAGECDMALAGGVNLLLSPETYVYFSRLRALSPTGRCRTFSADADGYVRSEGGGMLLLKRLSDAVRDGDSILALIRGSAVNQDGRSNGFTAPNGPSQQAVIRAALQQAGLAASAISYVECHGTGTPLGDPMEVQALAAVYGHQQPVAIGSVKSNLGHAEAAAGVASLLKTIVCMQHRKLSANLHFREPSPHIPWAEIPVSVVAQARPWLPDGQPLRAGVSSFGFSGTNAHVIVEEAPSDVPAQTSQTSQTSGPELTTGQVFRTEVPVLPILVSAKSSSALSAQVARLRSHVLAHDTQTLLDLAYSLAVHRAHFPCRQVLYATGRSALVQDLAQYLDRGPAPRPQAGYRAERLAFLFTGQGSQQPGMGAELYRVHPGFRDSLDRCESYFDRELKRPLLEVMFAPPGSPEASLVHSTAYAQPALFALEYALFQLFSSWGITPDAVMGHSLGEIAAACAADVFSLEDACRLVAARGRLMDALPRDGAMIAVQAPEADVLPLLQGTGGSVAIAAVNGPSWVVISGLRRAALAVCSELKARGTRCEELQVSHAFHSPLMEPMMAELRRVAQTIAYREPSLLLISNLTGGPVTTEVCDPEFWVRHVREPVRFNAGMRALAQQGCQGFVEIGPDAVLSALAARCLDSEGPDTERLFLPVLRAAKGDHGRADWQHVLAALGTLHMHGRDVNWQAFFAPLGGRKVPLPTYAFQREPYWLPPPSRDAGTANTLPDTAFWEAVAAGDVDGLGTILEVAAEHKDVQASLRTLMPVLKAWHRRQRHATDTWHYREIWEPAHIHGKEQEAGGAAAQPALTGAETGSWLILAPPDCQRMLDAIAQALGAQGAGVITRVLEPGSDQRAACAKLLRDAETDAQGQPLRGVVSLLALDRSAHPEHPAVPRGLADTLGLMQALGNASTDTRLWLITCGAVSIGCADRLEHPWQAMTWGLGRSFALAQPQRWGGLLDLPAELDAQTLAPLRSVMVAEHGETELALRPAGIFARRLTQAPSTPGMAEWKPRGTVLITGGSGALGGHIARWLARQGAEHLVLTSRRGGAAPGMSALMDELRALGARVTMAACDVADREALTALLDRLEAAGAWPTAVMHAAGTTSPTPLQLLTPAELADALAGKALGAEYLHELFATRPLDAFVTFSSVAAIWGDSSQSAYAAANAFLDALACHRASRGLSALSVAWGPWDGAGMASGGGREHLDQLGLATMQPAKALEALGHALAAAGSNAVVVDVDWKRWVRSLVDRVPLSFLRCLPEAQSAIDEAMAASRPASGTADLAKRLHSLPPRERLEFLISLVQAETAAVLQYPDPSRIERDVGFLDMGLDSLRAIELRRRLQYASGLYLTATMTFDHPSPRRLAAHLLATLDAQSAGAHSQSSELGIGIDSSSPAAQALEALDEDALIAAVGSLLDSE